MRGAAITVALTHCATAFRPAIVTPPGAPRAVAASRSASGGYYEVIGGLKHDREAMDAARAAVEGRGDGRVSMADADDILATLVDGPTTQAASGNSITEVEYRTAFRILADFRFTEEARARFIEKSLAAV